MVKIAVAGGSGRTALHTEITTTTHANVPLEVGQEVIDALVAAKKHEITIFSRNVSNQITTPLGFPTVLLMDFRRIVFAPVPPE